jgi:preprotein translocase subunit SecA
MFGQLMATVSREYVQYVMHVQVVKEEQPKLQPMGRLSYSAPEGPSDGGPALPPIVAAEGEHEAAAAAEEPATQQPVVKSEWEKTPRNAPCPCGSGKKYKLCHGAS